jgi:hypothetical protein
MIGDETARYVIGALIGLPWPEGDPEVCRRAAKHWRNITAAVNDSELGTQRSSSVLAEAHASGASIEAFQGLSKDLRLRLARIGLASEQLAVALERQADKLEETQNRFRSLAARVLIDIAVTIGFGFITVGLSQAVATVYLARVFTLGAKTLAELSAFNRALVTASYYLVDSIAYTIADVGALKVVDLLRGESEVGWGTAGRTFGANLAFDGAVDGGKAAVGGAVGKVFGSVAGDLVANNIWTRAAIRLAASGLVYTPVDNALGGKPYEDWLPSKEQWAQKALIHVVGRPAAERHYKGVEDWVERTLGR